MYLTVQINFKYPLVELHTAQFDVTIDQIPTINWEWYNLEDLYGRIISWKNEHLYQLNKKTNLYLLDCNDFKYRYVFTNPHGDNITIIPDNKLSTKQLLFLYEFNIENNSQIVIKCKDNESEEQELSKQFEALKRSVVTTNIQIVDLHYSNII